MYNIKLSDYVPEPKPVTSDLIVAAHYYAAWKKGAAEIHGGFDDLHGYPERTPLMGYYDEENPEVCDWEIKWASEHGINCFIHCWYRKKENMGKPVTVNDLRCGHGLHEALFNAKYQKYMKFAIMFEASPRWGGTDKDDMLENLMPFWTEQYFKRGNYLIIDNKPVLFIYQQERLGEECFKDAEEQRKTFDACREYAKSQGFDGMIFAANKYGGMSFETLTRWIILMMTILSLMDSLMPSEKVSNLILHIIFLPHPASGIIPPDSASIGNQWDILTENGQKDGILAPKDSGKCFAA